jgi:hypothetical protein
LVEKTMVRSSHESDGFPSDSAEFKFAKRCKSPHGLVVSQGGALEASTSVASARITLASSGWSPTDPQAADSALQATIAMSLRAAPLLMLTACAEWEAPKAENIPQDSRSREGKFRHRPK